MITEKSKHLFTCIWALLVSSFVIPCQVFACFSISFISSFLFNLRVSLYMLDTINYNYLCWMVYPFYALQIPSINSLYIHRFHFLAIIVLDLKNSCGMKVNEKFRESMNGSAGKKQYIQVGQIPIHDKCLLQKRQHAILQWGRSPVWSVYHQECSSSHSTIPKALH